jgi:exopolyphosphatase / guanosine-5'-triphosphate,3'-diphosphate pyrophosphatase
MVYAWPRQPGAGCDKPSVVVSGREKKQGAGRHRQGSVAEARRGQAGTGSAYAALDLGTNNCRLLIARPVLSESGAGGFKVVDSFSRIVRLGEGLGAGGLLSEAAMSRTIAALSVCARKMKSWRVVRSRAVATAACRHAENSAAFVARVARETGLALEIISAEEEARLTVASCAPLFDHAHDMALVFDIGGGSTELIWLALEEEGVFRTAHWISVPLGVVTLAERFGGQEVTVEGYEAMIAHAAREIEKAGLPAGWDPAALAPRTHLMGTSGTLTILASLHLDLPRYERTRIDGLWLAPDEIRRVSGALRGMSYEARINHGCIGRDRADLVIPGAAIFEAIWRLWPCEKLRVADRGLREGMLLGLMSEKEPRARRAAGS